MERKVTVRCLGGTQRLGVARNLAVVTDRGGPDAAGCTSGELLLLAIGSCSIGGVKSLLDEQALPSGELTVDVGFEPYPDAGQRDRIVVVVNVPAAAQGLDDEALRAAATAGRVSGRLSEDCDLEVRLVRRPD